MSNHLFRAITVIDRRSPHHRQTVDLALSDGRIEEIGRELQPSENPRVLSNDGPWYVSPGWYDLRAAAGEPGQEHRETIVSLLSTASAGGYTSVLLSPETKPSITTRAQVEYIHRQARGHSVNLSVSARMADDEGHMSEMLDLRDGGVSAFTVSPKHQLDEAVLSNLLQYARAIGLPVHIPLYHHALDENAQMHEGLHNVALGMRGSPSMAEAIQLQTLLHLVRYTGCTVHFTGVSSAMGVQLIREAKAEGLPISADTTAHHLTFSDEDLYGFNSTHKFRPPLRSTDDRAALRNALLDGTLDCIASDHSPWEVDRKNIEFGLAAFGAIGLQTTFPLLLNALGEDNLERIVDLLSLKPRALMNAQVDVIEAGSETNLTLFSTTALWTIDERTSQSLSRNSPLWKESLTGAALGIINGADFLPSPLFS